MKKEPLSIITVKTLLAVILIVCIGAVIGLMGWVMTKQHETDNNSIKGKISMQIFTDKAEYDIGEDVKIKVSLTNISPDDIKYSEPNCYVTGNKNWLPADISVATKYENINLYQKGIKMLSTVCPGGVSSMKSQETRKGDYEWNQKVYTRSFFKAQAPSGEYKITAKFCEFGGSSEKQNCHSTSTMIKIKGNAKKFLTKDEAIEVALSDKEVKEWYENHKGANFKDFFKKENGECYVKNSLSLFLTSDHLCELDFNPEIYFKAESGKCYRFVKPRNDWKQVPFNECKEIKNIEPETIGGVLIEEDSKYVWYVFFSALDIKKKVDFYLSGLQDEQIIKNFKKGPNEISVKMNAYSGKVLEIKECGYECRKKYHHF